MKKISINEFIKDYAEHDLENQRSGYFGFYDWFCQDKALKNKAKAMIPKLRFLLSQGILNGKTTAVIFKNNCPLYGSLYDDMRFVLLDYKETFLGGIAPSSGHDNEKGVCRVWNFVNEYNEIKFKNWSAFQKEVRSNEQFRNELKNAFYRDLE